MFPVPRKSMSVTCVVKYKESCKRLVVDGEKTVSDVRAALLTSPFFKDLVDTILIQVKDKILNEFFYIDETTIVADGDVLRLVENPFLDLTAVQPLQISVPGLEISYDSTASYPGPALIEPTPGPSGYKFHGFPVNICQEIVGTKEGQVSGTLRAKIVKQIVSALCVNTMYPCEHYLSAAKDLVSRYPQLKDKSRTHCASWHASIKHRARNIRRRMPAGVNEVDTRKAQAKAHRERRAALHCNQQCRPKNAVRNVFPAASRDTGEDEASVQGQVDLMKKEMKKTVWDQKKVQDAMNRTYKARRAWLNTENLTVAVVTDRYPALARAQEIQQDSRRQTGRDAQDGLAAFLERSTKALYELFRMMSLSKQKAKQILEAAENCPEEGKTLLANGALTLLPCLLKERSNNLVKSLEPGTQYMNPSILYTGEDALTSSVYAVTVEGLTIDAGSLTQAVSLLMCLFWAFNIEYSAEIKNTLTLLERAIGVSHTKMGTLALQVWSCL